MMSEKYRLMIYFAHSTIALYSKTIECRKTMTVGEFREANKDVIQRVFDEGISIFNYELSYHQMEAAIYAYLCSVNNPQSVYETKVFEITEK